MTGKRIFVFVIVVGSGGGRRSASVGVFGVAGVIKRQGDGAH